MYWGADEGASGLEKWYSMVLKGLEPYWQNLDIYLPEDVYFSQ